MSVRDIGELVSTWPGAHETCGLRVDDLVYGVGVTGHDRHTGELAADLPGQVAVALANVDAQLADHGGSVDNVARVGFHLRDPADIRLVNDVWTTRFPDERNRPTYKFLRAELDGQQQVRLDFFAVLGHRRQCLYLPNVAHGNPIPMAVLMGRYLFTSRVLPYDPDTGHPGADGASQARLAVLNTGALLAESGMTWRNVRQGRAFVADPADDEFVRVQWRTHADPTASLHITRYRAGALAVLLETVAVG